MYCKSSAACLLPAPPTPSATVGATATLPADIAAPTATPTPIASDTALPLATPTSTVTPLSSSTPLPTTTLAPGWSFPGVQMTPDPASGGLLVYGDVANNTGTAQELSAIVGKFYDAQGTVIADENTITDYWPVRIIPSGARVPFELFVPGIQDAARFELTADAQPTTGRCFFRLVVRSLSFVIVECIHKFERIG